MNDSFVNKSKPPLASKAPSAKSLQNYLQEADWTLSRVIAILFHTAIYLVLITLCAISLSFEVINIFEHQEGLADVSTIEIMFITSFFILMKRYWAYTKQTSLRWWNIITSPLIWYGRFVLFALFCASFIAFFDLHNGTELYKIIIVQGQSYDQIVSFCFLLISLYIAVPSKDLIVKSETPAQPSEKPKKTATIKPAPEVENVQ